MIDVDESILSIVGRTPLVRIARAIPDCPFQVYAKVEGLNPGGSIKDRPAMDMIVKGIQSGLIRSETTVVESSSGNMGIGLAQACRYFGIRLICVVDPKATRQNIRLMEAYGAEVDLVSEPDPETNEFLPARINRVRYLLSTLRDSFWPNQYANPDNAISHYRTMDEIVTALDGQVDYIFCATSTCGTLRGCADYVRERSLAIKIVAVDAIGSIIHGGVRSKRLIPGHGAAVVPELYASNLASHCIHVSDVDCIVGCRRLARREALLAGGSSGAILMALDHAKHMIPRNSRCVLIFADRGERYLDTIFSDSWVKEHFGDISHQWKDEVHTADCSLNKPENIDAPLVASRS